MSKKKVVIEEEEVTESITLTIDQQLDDIERFLITSLHTKVINGEPLSSQELQLVTRWLKSRDTISKPKKPKDTLIDSFSCTSAPALPFTQKRESVDDLLSEED